MPSIKPRHFIKSDQSVLTLLILAQMVRWDTSIS
jgi:hypothetical protein